MRFRVWDKKAERMYYHEHYIDNNGVVYSLDSQSTYITDNPDLLALYDTGRRDRKGKEIYEGDICKNLSNGYIFVIEWNEDFAGFRAVNPLYDGSVGAPVVDADFNENFDSRNYEVVGNRYETHI